MLEAMTEFIIGMREEYLGDKGRLVMVTHDWGSVIGGRLASEAEKLADRWIITSVCLVCSCSSKVQEFANVYVL